MDFKLHTLDGLNKHIFLQIEDKNIIKDLKLLGEPIGWVNAYWDSKPGERTILWKFEDTIKKCKINFVNNIKELNDEWDWFVAISKIRYSKGNTPVSVIIDSERIGNSTTYCISRESQSIISKLLREKDLKFPKFNNELDNRTEKLKILDYTTEIVLSLGEKLYKDRMENYAIPMDVLYDQLSRLDQIFLTT